MNNKKDDGKKFFLIYFLFFLLLNPLSFSIVFNHVLHYTLTDIEQGMFGLYAIGWFLICIIFILPRFFNFKPKETKIKTMDEIIDDCWKDYRKEQEEK